MFMSAVTGVDPSAVFRGVPGGSRMGSTRLGGPGTFPLKILKIGPPEIPFPAWLKKGKPFEIIQYFQS